MAIPKTWIPTIEEARKHLALRQVQVKSQEELLADYYTAQADAGFPDLKHNKAQLLQAEQEHFSDILQ